MERKAHILNSSSSGFIESNIRLCGCPAAKRSAPSGDSQEGRRTNLAQVAGHVVIGRADRRRDSDALGVLPETKPNAERISRPISPCP